MLNKKNKKIPKDWVHTEEDRIKALIANIPVGIIVVDLEGGINFVSSSAEDILGYSGSDILGRNIFEFLHSKDKERALRRFGDILKRPGSSTTSQYKVLHKDNSYVWMEVTGTNLADNKDINGIVLSFHSIAERRRREKREEFLKKATIALGGSLNYKKLLQEIANISVSFFSDWCIIYLKEEGNGFERVAVAYKDSEKAPIAKKIYEINPLPEYMREILRSVSSGGEGIINNDFMEIFKSNPEANELYKDIWEDLGAQSIMLVPIKSRNSTLGVMCFAKNGDNSVYKKDDLRFAEEFTQRIAFALDNAILYSDLEKNNKAKDVFLASLAHELRNPMAPIMNAVELMRAESIKNSNIEDCINIIDRQTQKTVHILDDLLDVSRITRGIFELHKDIVSASKIAINSTETAIIFTKQKNQTLDIDICKEDLLIDAEEIRIEQVLVNLLDNASKYTQEGGRIEFSCSKEGRHAVFRVKDNGQGIHPDFMPHIFDIFVQADKSLNREVQDGLGIGLALVKELTEMHGGSVEVKSKGIGKGTEFILKIPLREDNSDKSIKKPDSVSDFSRISSEEKRDTLSVLVVDDNIDAASSLGKLLERSGYHIEIAHNGVDALDIISKVDLDVIMLDIGLPGMSGYEIARKIRSKEKNKNTLMIALTGYGQPEDKEKAKKAGFDYHVTKPVSVIELQGIMEKHLVKN